MACLYHCDCSRVVTQMYNFGAETHLGAVWSYDCLCLPVIAQILAWTFIGSIARKAHEDSDYTAMTAVMH